jgi:hypothetical protein
MEAPVAFLSKPVPVLPTVPASLSPTDKGTPALLHVTSIVLADKTLDVWRKVIEPKFRAVAETEHVVVAIADSGKKNKRPRRLFTSSSGFGSATLG